MYLFKRDNLLNINSSEIEANKSIGDLENESFELVNLTNELNELPSTNGDDSKFLL